MNRHEKNLVKLLTKHGYELVSENGFGVRVYRLPDCRDIEIIPHPNGTASAAICASLTRTVLADLRRHDPENTPEAHTAQLEWEQEEQARQERERADRELVRNKRLGGLSAVLTESEVDAVTRRTEQILAEQRAYQRLVRNRINA